MAPSVLLKCYPVSTNEKAGKCLMEKIHVR